ncbi:MAG: phosphatidylcholine synthase [Pseudolabrys sp.]|nr:phosphatidylcholine synthase [Pseudolabrys sp.]
MPGFVRFRAFLVHILTASGAGLALLAMIFATGGEWPAMFLCLGVALLVDGVDGPIARAFKVEEVLPRWSGAMLDNVVDFTTYVFVPAYAIAASGLMPPGFAVPAGLVVVITGAIYFADNTMKTADNYFSGFPAVWNMAAFYLFVMAPPSWVALGAVVALAGLTFAPIRFVHPLRVRHMRLVNIALLAIWAVLAFLAVIQNLMPGPYVTWPLGFIAAYFLIAGLLRRPA